MKNVDGSNRQGGFNNYRSLFIATLLSAVVAGAVTGCGGGGGGGKGPILGTGGNGTGSVDPSAAPVVTTVTPQPGSTIATNLKVFTATFSKAMNPATLNGTTFTVECPSGSPCRLRS
ncbi:MAG TPA: Ig-like domain-containing protein [Pseudomonadales bacterium]|nr:Ig-like domain-containing protein [Pseudomonadales bacterium]